jgi:hypothetical protein
MAAGEKPCGGEAGDARPDDCDAHAVVPRRGGSLAAARGTDAGHKESLGGEHGLSWWWGQLQRCASKRSICAVMRASGAAAAARQSDAARAISRIQLTDFVLVNFSI